MTRSLNVTKKDERRDAPPEEEEAGTFDRSFKYAIIIYAVVEFFAVALVLYYSFAR
jgi:hypothetical protein